MINGLLIGLIGLTLVGFGYCKLDEKEKADRERNKKSADEAREQREKLNNYYSDGRRI